MKPTYDELMKLLRDVAPALEASYLDLSESRGNYDPSTRHVFGLVERVKSALGDDDK